MLKGKGKFDNLLAEQLLQGFEISRAFLLAKLVVEKRGKFQNTAQ